MRTIRTIDLAECAALAEDWDQLAGGVPFRSCDWLSAWWRHYAPAMREAGRHVELYTLCVVDGNRLLGVAPWYLDQSRTGGAVVRFLGSGEACSDYLTILCQPDDRLVVIDALAQWLARSAHAPGGDDRWDMLEWDQVSAGDEMLEGLAARLRDDGAEIHIRPAENTWRIELPASCDEYLQLQSNSHRKQLRQLQRRWVDSQRAVLRSVETADQLERGWRTLVELHQRRLTSLGKPGCFQSRAFARFHQDVTAAMWRSGSLHLHWLEVDGQPVAAEHHVAGGDVMYAYLGGIEPTALDCQPGRLITVATIGRAIAAGFRAFDFCRGDEPFKAHFRAQPRSSATWRIVCNRPTARLRHNMWVAGHSARRWVKNSLQRVVGQAR